MKVSKITWVLLGLAGTCYIFAATEVAMGLVLFAVVFELLMYYSLLVDSQNPPNVKTTDSKANPTKDDPRDKPSQ
jgi:hypothetical protein